MRNKNLMVAFAGMSLVGLLTTRSLAQQIASDGFNYTPSTASNPGSGEVGGLDGNDGGVGWVVPGSGGASTNAWVPADTVGSNVVSGSLTYPGLQASVGNSTAGNLQSSSVSQSQRSFLTTPQASGTIYISELVNLAPVAAEGRTPYAANFIRVGNGSGQYQSTFTGSFGFDGDYGAEGGTQQLFIDPGGFVRTGGPEAIVTAIPAGLSLTTTHLLVAELNLDADTISLYIDPTVGNPQPGSAILTASVPNLTANFSGLAGVSQLDLAADDNDGGDPAIVDELRVGDSWADVTPGVPEPGSLAILTLSGLALLSRGHRKPSILH